MNKFIHKWDCNRSFSNVFSCGIKKWLAFTVGYHTDSEFDHFLITGPNHLCRFSGDQQQENYYSILKQNLHVKISAFFLIIIVLL